MENLFQGVSVYLEDVMVTGSTIKDHLQNLDKVLGILAKAGLTLNQSKCLEQVQLVLPSLSAVLEQLFLHFQAFLVLFLPFP